ncbi:MAG TPA: dockerin type I domain-containing protein [Phycisphaerae bacterium]|nr:dockerin type I domain-containing protein [Phycisphaerae bacterium]HRW53381.1 dockerin type I domain-containing protein [Phycisphaerae bacterium]
MTATWRKISSRLAVPALALVCGATALAQTATFAPVQPLSGDPNDILSLNDMTSDGAVLIGVNKTFSPPGAPSVILARPADLDCIRDSDMTCVSLQIQNISGDGVYFSGWDASDGGGFRWRPGAPRELLLPLGPVNPYDHIVPTFLSQDGAVAVGTTFQAGLTRAFRWTQETGVVDLGDAPGVESVAYAASSDGAVIVGSRNSGTGRRAFRWSAEDGVTLIDLGTDVFSEATAISADGRIVAGVGDLGMAGGSGFIWSADAGARSIPFPSGVSGLQQPAAVSTRGDIVVGTLFPEGGGAQVAFVWDDLHGTRLLRDVLLTQGAANVDGWSLSAVRAASDDALTLTGVGDDPETQISMTWLAELAPLARRGDVNCDGAIDGADIAAFSTAILSPAAYATQFPSCEILTADINRDASVDTLDIPDMVAALIDTH